MYRIDKCINEFINSLYTIEWTYLSFLALLLMRVADELGGRGRARALPLCARHSLNLQPK